MSLRLQEYWVDRKIPRIVLLTSVKKLTLRALLVRKALLMERESVERKL